MTKKKAIITGVAATMLIAGLIIGLMACNDNNTEPNATPDELTITTEPTATTSAPATTTAAITTTEPTTTAEPTTEELSESVLTDEQPPVREQTTQAPPQVTQAPPPQTNAPQPPSGGGQQTPAPQQPVVNADAMARARDRTLPWMSETPPSAGGVWNYGNFRNQPEYTQEMEDALRNGTWTIPVSSSHPHYQIFLDAREFLMRGHDITQYASNTPITGVMLVGGRPNNSVTYYSAVIVVASNVREWVLRPDRTWQLEGSSDCGQWLRSPTSMSRTGSYYFVG
jgi:hypothetical protein